MVLVLKVYLYVPHIGKSEVRRVSVTSDYLHSYNTLCAKIITLFPELVGKTFKVYWKDEEKDDILMSTDEELYQAVANAANEMLKVYVKVTHDGPNAAAGVDCEVVHTNVVCDACNQVIKGHRYKCLQCEDFDLCTSCNALDKHPAHDMVKLVSPSSISRAWFFRGWRSMWQSMFGHEASRDSHGHHHWRGHHGHHGHPSFKKNKGEKCPFAESEGNKDIVNMIGQGLSNLLSPFVESMEVYMSDDKEAPSDAGRSSCPVFQTQGSKCSAGNEKGTSTEEVVGDCCAASAACNEECIVVEKVVGDSPAAAEEESKKGEPVGKTAAGATGGFEPMETGEASLPSASRENSPKSDASSPISMANPAAFLSAMSKIIAQQSGAAGVKPKGLYATLQEAAKTIDDWTIVNAPTAPEENDVSQTEPKTATSSSVPEQPKPDDELPPASAGTPDSSSHPAIDPRYEGALNYMMSMGFNNDGNWLSQLIQAKNGNVNEVLDAMYRK